MDPTICSILRPLRSWASSPSGGGAGSSRFLSHVFGLVPFGETTPGDLVSFGETISSATIHLFDLAPFGETIPGGPHTTTPSLRPPTLSPSLSRTGKPRHPYRATPGTPPRRPASGTSISPAPPGLAGRPGHFTSPASSILQVFLIYAKFCYSLLHGT